MGPRWTGKNGFANLFIFAKIFTRKVRKLRVCLDVDFVVFIFLNHCYWVCKHTQVPFFIWLFPSKSLQSFRKCPRIVIVMSTTMPTPCLAWSTTTLTLCLAWSTTSLTLCLAWSTTTLTLCLLGQLLLQNHVHRFNNYADIVTVRSTTTPTLCPWGQRLCQHSITI